MDPLESYVAYLQQKHWAMTPARLAVAKAAIAQFVPFEADSLLTECEAISRPSVYRTLSELVEAGVLARAQYGDSVRFFRT